jgi:hypothetical protein
MDPLSASTMLSTLVGLLAQFKAERHSASNDESRDFLEWLVAHNFDNIRRLIEESHVTTISVKALLNQDHDEIVQRLAQVGQQIASVVARNEAFAELARALASTAATKPAGDTFSVTSHNQQGGITAGQINFHGQPGWRDINQLPNLQKQLENELNQYRNRTFLFTAVMGDEEAHQFAHQLRDWFKGMGFAVEEFVSQSVFTAPQPAISYQFEGDDKILVKAGNQNSPLNRR